jgi:hypothetical protein
MRFSTATTSGSSATNDPAATPMSGMTMASKNLAEKVVVVQATIQNSPLPYSCRTVVLFATLIWRWSDFATKDRLRYGE